MEPKYLEAYLRLYHSPELGNALFSTLLAQFGGIEPLLTFSQTDFERAGVRETLIVRILAARQDSAVDGMIHEGLAWLDENSHSRAIICYQSDSYPERLRQIPSAPPLLFAIGSTEHLQEPMLAIVGSRRASSAGLRNADWLARELSESLVICSGLARGIDCRAHRGALASGRPTVAVMGTGADRVYPDANDKLAEQISKQGTLVTEFPLGYPPLAENFPRRNRIISGLALGTLVVEATPKSGSLITARFALEQNREVFAVPGAISSQGSRGCHQLLKQGAKLVEEATDVLEELGIPWSDVEAASVPENSGLNSASESDRQQAILQALGADGCVLDTLLDVTGLQLQELTAEILQLEISGKVESIGGRYVRLPVSGSG